MVINKMSLQIVNCGLLAIFTTILYMVQTFRQSLISSDDFTLKKEAAGFSESARAHTHTHTYIYI
jgi:hypothetical protein